MTEALDRAACELTMMPMETFSGLSSPPKALSLTISEARLLRDRSRQMSGANKTDLFSPIYPCPAADGGVRRLKPNTSTIGPAFEQVT
jgi:hypothetical protein